MILKRDKVEWKFFVFLEFQDFSLFNLMLIFMNSGVVNFVENLGIKNEVHILTYKMKDLTNKLYQKLFLRIKTTQ